MINRELYAFLENWKMANSRLPLILRGARQVGKTTLINQFGLSFDQYLYFNLEREKDRAYFEKSENIDTIVQLLFIAKNKVIDDSKSTLIFIDEVQECPKVIEYLRYFYEDYPHLHIIVTGSLLEFALENIERIPVGRVEFAILHPISFKEYLKSLNQNTVLELLEKTPLSNELLSPIYSLFHEYALIGGMPQVVKNYLSDKNASRLKNIYAGIVESYKIDIEKYAKNNTQKNVLRHIMAVLANEVDKRITFNNFGHSNYKTREVKEAFLALEKAKLVELIYPSTNVSIPIYTDFNKSPRLQFLDIGLLNYLMGILPEVLTISDLHALSRGKLVQQIVTQELKSEQYLPSQKLHFWVRDENGTSSEVDLIYPFKNMLIPIEIKAGASGTLKSLNEYMDRCSHVYAVRLYAGKISIDSLITRKGKSYKLLNLPYFMGVWLDQYLDWFIAQD